MPLLIPIGPNFWNLRGSFKPMPCFDFGSQMCFIKLSTGKFVVLSTVAISSAAKAEIDALTENGKLIEAVIATHPFHTLYFDAFYKLYPGAKYYGTPRHLRRIKSLQWAGDVSNPEVLTMYESEGLHLRIPDGADFINPPDSNHFTGVIAYHAGSKTLADDDTIMCFERPGCLLGCFGIRAGQVSFHPAPWKDNLLPTAEAPIQFRDFMQRMLDDWDFDNIVAAHTGIKIGGAKAAIQDIFKKEIPALEKLSKYYA
jgi:hypothetical protein